MAPPRMSRSSEIGAEETVERQRFGIPDKDGKIRNKRYWGMAKAAYRAVLPPAPVGPCTRERAAIYARDIQRVLDDCDQWTRNERSRLHRDLKKWQARARGEDRRFEAMGGVFGGLNDRHRPYTPGDCLADIRKILTDDRERDTRRLSRSTDEELYTCRTAVDQRAKGEESMTTRLRRLAKDRRDLL